MAASSSSSNDEDQRPYHIEHHYLDVYFDELFLVGCTPTAAYLVTKCGEENYTAHRITFADATRNKPLQNGAFMPQWKAYSTIISKYLNACAHASMLCIIEEDGFKLLRDLDLSICISSEFNDCHACCINEEYLIVVHNNRQVFVYNYMKHRTICNKQLKHSIVDVEFFFTCKNMFILTTSKNDTLFYIIDDESNDIQLTRRVCLLDAQDAINFTREIHPYLFATCSRSELSIARRVADETRIQVRTDFPSTIVSVAVMTGDRRTCLFVHDVEGCVQMMNWRLETFRTISNHELFKPHNECRIPIQRIQTAYKSMTIYADLFMILLPSADLCIIKFN